MTTELLPPPRTSTPVDQAQADRLARLANRRPAAAASAAGAGAGAGAGVPIPPPARTARTGATPPPSNRPAKRRHAARGSRAAALAMSVVTTGGLAAWFGQAAQASSTTLAAVGTTGTTGTTAASGTATPATTATASGSGSGSATAVAQSTATSATATAATTTAATYTGTAVTMRYGTVQVAITTANGTITDVQAVALPSGGKNDQYSNKAAPVLRTEAVAAQTASINVVSGATYTSKAYIQSLQSAIDQAVTAGAVAS